MASVCMIRRGRRRPDRGRGTRWFGDRWGKSRRKEEPANGGPVRISGMGIRILTAGVRVRISIEAGQYVLLELRRTLDIRISGYLWEENNDCRRPGGRQTTDNMSSCRWRFEIRNVQWVRTAAAGSLVPISVFGLPFPPSTSPASPTLSVSIVMPFTGVVPCTQPFLVTFTSRASSAVSAARHRAGMASVGPRRGAASGRVGRGRSISQNGHITPSGPAF